MNVGDYVRTDKGLIGKVIKKEEYDTHTILEYKGQYCKRVLSTTGTDSEVIKSSPDIIDLIQEGDYVNGYLVEEIYQPVNKEMGKLIKFSTDNVYGWEYGAEEIKEEEIKSIVTKEQFESMEYKVNE